MRKTLFVGLLLMAGVVSAQKMEPKYEIVGKQVKATYYYDSGQVKQEGFYKDGKLNGKWIAYNEDGSKQSMGEYSKGMKTGKWFFWNNTTLAEVDYNRSAIVEIKKWTKDAIVNRN